MKSLETDAVHAQAVIAKAQELSRGSSQRPPPAHIAAVDIAFAGQWATGHNAECRISIVYLLSKGKFLCCPR